MGAPLMVHNIGRGPEVEDMPFKYPSRATIDTVRNRKSGSSS